MIDWLVLPHGAVPWLPGRRWRENPSVGVTNMSRSASRWRGSEHTLTRANRFGLCGGEPSTKHSLRRRAATGQKGPLHERRHATGHWQKTTTEHNNQLTTPTPNRARGCTRFRHTLWRTMEYCLGHLHPAVVCHVGIHSWDCFSRPQLCTLCRRSVGARTNTPRRLSLIITVSVC